MSKGQDSAHRFVLTKPIHSSVNISFQLRRHGLLCIALMHSALPPPPPTIHQARYCVRFGEAERSRRDGFERVCVYFFRQLLRIHTSFVRRIAVYPLRHIYPQNRFGIYFYTLRLLYVIECSPLSKIYAYLNV